MGSCVIVLTTVAGALKIQIYAKLTFCATFSSSNMP